MENSSNDTRNTVTALLAIIALMISGLLAMVWDNRIFTEKQDQYRSRQIKGLRTEQKQIVKDVGVVKEHLGVEVAEQ